MESITNEASEKLSMNKKKLINFFFILSHEILHKIHYHFLYQKKSFLSTHIHTQNNHQNHKMKTKRQKKSTTIETKKGHN